MYDEDTGTLFLQHKSQSSATTYQAAINVEHVLESLRQSYLEIGARLNIVGYKGRETSIKESAICSITVDVQALMLWSAGDVNLDEYVKTVEERRAAENRIKATRKDWALTSDSK